MKIKNSAQHVTTTFKNIGPGTVFKLYGNPCIFLKLSKPVGTHDNVVCFDSDSVDFITPNEPIETIFPNAVLDLNPSTNLNQPIKQSIFTLANFSTSQLIEELKLRHTNKTL